MRASVRLAVLTGLLASSAGGCRMGVPIHVWQKPRLRSTVGQRVAVSQIAGPEELTERVERLLISAAPTEPGRSTCLVDAATLPDEPLIRQVSANEASTNDLVLAAKVRRQGIGYLLRGEVIDERQSSGAADQLKLSWRLTALGDGLSSGGGSVDGMPVVVDVESAVQRYPDLGSLPDARSILASAAARDTYRLITPWVDRQRVALAIPYLLPGSRQVRRGNAAAHAGRWAEAERIWAEVLADHPGQAAAIHNLALAAAAAQDFSRAKRLARRAIRKQPTALHQETLVWIELQQREYHQAFGLPDPAEGWFVTGGR